MSSAPTPSAGPSTYSSILHDTVVNTQTALTKLEVLQKGGIEFRLLSAFLEHAPTTEGVNEIATDIIAASAYPDGLEKLTDFYKTGLLLPMKAGGRTPPVSYHPSRDQEIRLEVEEIVADLEIAKKDPGMLKKYTFRRDGHRCVVTRNWDYSSLAIPSVWSQFNSATDGRGSDFNEATHILPLSLMRADMNKKLHNKTTIWTVIKSFTGIEFKELSSDNINSLTNIITLTTSVHEGFRSLMLWFEAIPGMSNTYKVKKAHNHFLRDEIKTGTEVTLTSPSPEILPLPDPRYLAFHAAIAKIVNMAGMAGHLDHIIDNYENIRVLSDESNLEYLDGLLRVVQI